MIFFDFKKMWKAKGIMVAGVGFEPHDLQVMSLTSYRTALPRDNEKHIYKIQPFLYSVNILFYIY